MAIFKILSRFSGSVLFEAEAGSLKIADHVYNSAADGQTVVGAQVWTNGSALLLVTSPQTRDERGVLVGTQNMGAMQIGRIFAWNRFGGEGEILEVRDDVSDETIYRIRQSTAVKVFGGRFGYLLTSV